MLENINIKIDIFGTKYVQNQKVKYSLCQFHLFIDTIIFHPNEYIIKSTNSYSSDIFYQQKFIIHIKFLLKINLNNVIIKINLS